MPSSSSTSSLPANSLHTIHLDVLLYCLGSFSSDTSVHYRTGKVFSNEQLRALQSFAAKPKNTSNFGELKRVCEMLEIPYKSARARISQARTGKRVPKYWSQVLTYG
jgi:hypothetical protein